MENATAAPSENGDIDSVWDEKLDGFDNSIRVIVARLYHVIIEGNGIIEVDDSIKIHNSKVNRSAGVRRECG